MQPGSVTVEKKYKILVGRLYDHGVKDYPAHEPLPTASMPNEMLPYTVQHRFRIEDGHKPLVQVGPGIVRLNGIHRITLGMGISKMRGILVDKYII